MAKIKRVQNDTAPDWTFSVARPDGTVPTLSGSTVNFIIKSPSGAVTNAGHQACTITDATTGEGYYTFLAGDLPDAGDYLCDLSIVYSNGQIETVPKALTLEARAEAG